MRSIFVWSVVVAAAVAGGCEGGSTQPDLALPDFAVPADLSAAPDLAVILDLAGGDAASPRLDLALPTPDEGPPDLATPIPTLTLSIDPTLDDSADTVKASAISSAALLDTTGLQMASATVVGGSAVFKLEGVAAADYFIEVNGDADDLVPTRIDDPTKPLIQRVGASLRPSFIGTSSALLYRVKTYSAGQGQSPVVRYSDGTAIAGAQPYVLVTLPAPQIEIRVLGTAKAIQQVTPQAMHAAQDPFASWLINTDGQLHHGDEYNASPPTCANCHFEMDYRPPMSSAIEPFRGWCYRCHNGTAGTDSGFVDPNQ
jgi:hypothetical protein